MPFCLGDKSVFNAMANDCPGPGSSLLQPLGAGTSCFVLVPPTANEPGLGFEIDRQTDMPEQAVEGLQFPF